MLKLSSRKTFESKRYPGVQVVIRVLSEGVRTRIRLQLAPALMKIRDLNKELEAIEIPKNESGETDPNAKVDPSVFSKIVRISDETTSITQTEIDPIYFKQGFVSISGIEIDGSTELSAEQLIELAPTELYDEIVEAIKHGSELSVDEAKNSSSPITSVEAQDGRDQNTTALSAKETSFT